MTWINSSLGHWEQQKGKRIFEQWNLDDLRRRHHMQVLLTLEPVPPPWAAWPEPGRGGFPSPQHLGDFEAFVSALAQRFRETVAVIEITNEPDLSVWMGPGRPFDEAVAIYALIIAILLIFVA